MAQKKYSLDKILKEYNKKYNHNYKLSPEVFDVTVMHDTGDKFYVIYTDADGIRENGEPLQDFIHLHISSSISRGALERIMLDKENKKLNLKIEIWPSNKIRYAYLSSNYFTEGIGDLGKSCMRYKSMQKALNFYVKNNVRIVVVIDDKNKILARALLWDNVESIKLKKPFTYLDRVYAKSDTLCSLFYDLAKENKWRRYPSTTVNCMDKNCYKKDIIVTGMCHLPFMDTFRYLYLRDNLLASSTRLGINRTSVPPTTLNEHTNCGYYPTLDPDRTQEAFTGAYVSKKDAVFIKRYEGNYGGYVLRNNIASIHGAYYSIRDSKIVKTTHGDYILKENSVNEVITNDTIDKTTAVHSDKYNGFIHKSNVVNIKGKLYHKKDTDVIYFGVKWYHISQCFINYDREEYNKELAAQREVDACYPFAFNLPYTTATITKKGDLIPREHAIIAYNLVYNGALSSIEYQEVYCTSMDNLVQLTTGEWVVNSSKNKKYLKKFNNKWYIRREFKLPYKKQLMFSFMDKEK